MKDFLVIVTILAVVFGGNYFIHSYLDNTGKDFLEEIDQLRVTISEEASVKKEQVSEILELWEKNEQIWIMLEYHQEINAIEDLFVECYNHYLQGDNEEFEISYGKLKRHVEDMKNREKITFTNIL